MPDPSAATVNRKYYLLFGSFSFSRTVMPPSRFDVAASGGVGPCFGEPPLPALPLPGGDDELFSPTSNGDLSPSCCVVGGMGSGGDGLSPTFDKPIMREMEKTIEGTRFVAQHMRNKDKFESVSIPNVSIRNITSKWIKNPTTWHPTVRARVIRSYIALRSYVCIILIII